MITARTKRSAPRTVRRVGTLARLAPLVAVLAWSGQGLAQKDAAGASPVVSFAEGKWDAAKWTPVRLPHHKEVKTFSQKPDCISVGPFSQEDKKGRLDNVLLMTDAGADEGQFEVAFTIGPERGTAPGFLISPTVRDGVVDKALSVFVATYTMAVWRAETDPEKGETKYTHLARLNRWTKPGDKHVFRCRYSKAKKSFVLQVDDSDPLMLRDVGVDVNSLVGVWGCHGTCNFYEFRMNPKPDLPWSATDPNEKK